jgi:uncharacterized protein
VRRFVRRMTAWWVATRSRACPTGRVRTWVISGIVVAAIALSAIGMAQLRTDTGTESFLPPEDATLQSLHEAAEAFGGDPVVVLVESTRPRALFAPRQLPKMLRLEGELARLPNVASVYGPGTVLNQIAGSAQNMLASLSGHRDALREAALRRARAEGMSPIETRRAVTEATEEFDQRYGSLLVRGLPAGLPTLHNQNFVEQVIFTDNGVPRAQWDFLVPASNAVSFVVRPHAGLDQAATERLVTQVSSNVRDAGLVAKRVTVTGAPALTAAMGERVRQEVPLIGALALVLVSGCYLLTPWVRHKRRRVLPLVATLGAILIVLGTFGWLSRPLSLGVIAFLPILLGIASDFPAYLAQAERRRPVVVASFGSAAAFGSLAVSPLPFVRDLGIALAAGQLVSLALACVMMPRPPATTAIHGLRQERRISPSTQLAHTALPPIRSKPGDRFAVRYGLLAMVGVIAATGWVLLGKLPVEARPDRLAEGLPAIADAHRAERILGASGELQVVLSGDDVRTTEALRWMRRTDDRIVLRHGDRLQPIVSPPSLLAFLGDRPTQEQLHAGMALMPDYLLSAVLARDGTKAVMSYRLPLQDLGRQKELIDSLRAGLPRPPEGMNAELVGLPVAAAHGYQLMLQERYVGNLVGVAAAGLVLLCGLRNRSDGLRAVIASLMATGWGLVMMTLLGTELTPLTLVLGSLNSAIACEFTIVLAHAARRGDTSLVRTVAVAAAAAGLSYLSLLTSELDILEEFGLFLSATVALSLLSAHLVVRLLPPNTERITGGEISSDASITRTEEALT